MRIAFNPNYIIKVGIRRIVSKPFQLKIKKKIGVLWRKEGKKGFYLSGTLDIGVLSKVNIAIFQNEKTESDDKG
jgi:hypothetical protein